MADNKIIPFGKYKGRTVEEVQSVDPQYLEWLSKQSWFVDKFKPIYNIVIQNFHQEPEETPEHNAMQVKFLDQGYCEHFATSVGLTREWAEAELRERMVVNATSPWSQEERFSEYGTRDKSSAVGRTLAKAINAKRWLREKRTFYREENEKKLAEARRDLLHYRTRRIALRQGAKLPITVGYQAQANFESGVDVLLTITVHAAEAQTAFKREWTYTFAIELKPTLGDDFPAVLRQMHAQYRAVPDAPYRQWILLVGHYQGIGATWDQVQAVFKASKITALLS